MSKPSFVAFSAELVRDTPITREALKQVKLSESSYYEDDERAAKRTYFSTLYISDDDSLVQIPFAFDTPYIDRISHRLKEFESFMSDFEQGKDCSFEFGYGMFCRPFELYFHYYKGRFYLSPESAITLTKDRPGYFLYAKTSSFQYEYDKTHDPPAPLYVHKLASKHTEDIKKWLAHVSERVKFHTQHWKGYPGRLVFSQ